MSSEDQQALRLRLVYFMRRLLFLALGMGMLLPTAAKANDFTHYKNRCILRVHQLLIKDKSVASAAQIDRNCHCAAKESVIAQKMQYPSWCPRYYRVKTKLMTENFTGSYD